MHSLCKPGRMAGVVSTCRQPEAKASASNTLMDAKDLSQSLHVTRCPRCVPLRSIVLLASLVSKVS